MKTLVLLVLVIACSSCMGALPNRYPEQGGPPAPGWTAYGRHHVVIEELATVTLEQLGVKPALTGAFFCGGYIFHELEETQNGKRLEWGIRDSLGDAFLPCLDPLVRAPIGRALKQLYGVIR